MPNENPRNELLITIDYLINNTSKENPLAQDELITYAQNKYNVTIDRRRITPMCKQLAQLTNKYTDKFLFEIVDLGESKRKNRFYGVKTAFTEEMLNNIILSLLKNTYITNNEQVQAMITRINQVALPEGFQNPAEPAGFYFQVRPTTLINRINKLRTAQNDNLIVSFKLRKNYNADGNRLNTNDTYHGYVYTLAEFNSKPYAAIYVPMVASLVIFDINHLRIVGDPYQFDEGRQFDFEGNFAQRHPNLTIEEHFARAGMPLTDGTVEDITFTFEKTDENVQVIQDSFRLAFRRKLDIPEGSNGEVVTIAITLNSAAFLAWATQIDIAQIIDVTGNETVRNLIIDYYKRLFLKNARHDEFNEYTIETRTRN